MIPKNRIADCWHVVARTGILGSATPLAAAIQLAREGKQETGFALVIRPMKLPEENVK
jgi:hypothetical protein